MEFLKTYSPLFLIVLLAGMFYKDVYPKLPKLKLEKASRYDRNGASSRGFYDRSWTGCKNCDDYRVRRKPVTNSTTTSNNNKDVGPKPPTSAAARRYASMGESVAYKYCLCCKKKGKKADRCKKAIKNKLKCRKREIRETYYQDVFMGAFEDRIKACE